jgi:type II secretion system protein N
VTRALTTAILAIVLGCGAGCGGGKKSKNTKPVLSFERDRAWKKDPAKVLARELRGRLPSYTVKLGKVELGKGYGDFTIRDLELRSTGAGPEAVIRFESLRVRASGGSETSIELSGTIGGEEVSGSLHFDDETLKVKLDADQLPVAAERGWTVNLASVPLAGSLEVHVDMTLPAYSWVGSKGLVQLTCHDCATRAAKVAAPQLGGGLGGGLSLPALRLGDLDLTMVIREGEATVQMSVRDQPDLRIEGDGSIRFSKPIRRSRAELCLRVELTPAGKQTAPTIATMLGFLPQATGSGVRLRVTGNLGRPRMRPSKTCDP